MMTAQMFHLFGTPCAKCGRPAVAMMICKNRCRVVHEIGIGVYHAVTCVIK